MSSAEKLFAVVLSIFSPGAGVMFLGNRNAGLGLLAWWHIGGLVPFAALKLGILPELFMLAVALWIVSSFTASIVMVRRSWRTAKPTSPVLPFALAIGTSLLARAVVQAMAAHPF